LRLTWKDNADTEDGFRLHRLREAQEPATWEVVTVGRDASAYDDQGLAAETRYRYRVWAFNAAGNSDSSPAVFAATLRKPAITLSPDTVFLSAEEGVMQPALDSVTVRNAGDDALTDLDVSIVRHAMPSGVLRAWLPRRDAPTTVLLEASAASVTRGSYRAEVFVASSVAANSPRSARVEFTVLPAIDTTYQLGGPASVAFSADGTAYVSAKESDASGGLYQLAPPYSRLTQAASMVGYPVAVAADAMGRTAYVGRWWWEYGMGHVLIFDVATGTPLDSIALPGEVLAVAVSPDDQRLYVGTDQDTLYIFDRVTLAARAKVPVFGGPVQIAFHPLLDRVYVSGSWGARVSEVEADSVRRTWVVPGRPRGLGFLRGASHLYVANEVGPLSVIDLDSGVLTDLAGVADSAFAVALTGDGEELAVAIPSASRVRLMNRLKLEVKQVIRTEFGPTSVTGNPAGTTWFIVAESRLHLARR
jgi:YVTN family beta-propeller protein